VGPERGPDYAAALVVEGKVASVVEKRTSSLWSVVQVVNLWLSGSKSRKIGNHGWPLYLRSAQRNLLLRKEEEWNLYESALILSLDTSTGEVRTCVDYKSPPETTANQHLFQRLQEWHLIGDTLYTCTSTEV